jgi:hypothetical protein
MVALDAVGLVLPGIELPNRQEHLVDGVVVSAVEPGAPPFQALDEPLGGGNVTTATFPVHQSPCSTIPSLPDPELVRLFFR